MLFFVDVRVKGEMSLDELWALWEKEAEAALAAKAAGTVVALYKVAGQRRVLVILNIDSHDELDRVLMAGPAHGSLFRIRGDRSRATVRDLCR